jgi:gamma-glutamylcyclotransferase (GGCT)/AIG2-like uncharacterized protein YtfP
MSDLHVFTYGTLKRGFRNHLLLATSAFVKEAVTKPKYKLYDCGHYPCMVKSESGISIQGEIFKIDETTLAKLDRLEGVPHLYKRDLIELQDVEFPVLAYFYQLDISKFIECGSVWPRK